MKRLLKELQTLVDTFGYWSKEVEEFNNKLDSSTMYKINNLVKR